MPRQEKTTTKPATSATEELEKKRREFQEQIAHKKKTKAPAKKPVQHSRKKLFFGFGLVLILLIGLGVAAVYALWFQNPDRVVGDAVFRALKANTMSFTGDIRAGQTFDAQFNGGTAGTKGAKFSFNSVLKYDDKKYDLGSDVILDKDGNVYMSAGGIKTALGSELVADAVNTGTYSNLLAQKLDGKWLKISSDQLQPYSKKVAAAQSCVEEVIRRNQTDEPLFGETADIYKQNKFIVVDTNLGTADGSTGYSVHIDQDKLKSFLTSFKDTALYRQLHDCDSATFALNPEKFVKSLANSDLRAQKIELWINDKHDITKVVVNGNASGLAGTMTVLPQFNQEVKIVVPTNLVSLTELHALLQDGTQALMLSKESDDASKQKIQALIEKLRTQQ